MAIPPGTKFHGVSPSVDTLDRGSASRDALREAYTIEDFGNPLSVTTTLSPAQILALDTTPVEFLPAQGVGKTIVVVSAWMKLLFNSVPYQFPNQGEIGLSTMPFDYSSNYSFTQSNFIVSNLPSINSSSDVWVLSNTGKLNVWTSTPLLENTPLSLYSSQAPVSLVGDSDVQFKVYYKIAE